MPTPLTTPQPPTIPLFFERESAPNEELFVLKGLGLVIDGPQSCSAFELKSIQACSSLQAQLAVLLPVIFFLLAEC